jgi:hypothetical protein
MNGGLAHEGPLVATTLSGFFSSFAVDLLFCRRFAWFRDIRFFGASIQDEQSSSPVPGDTCRRDLCFSASDVQMQATSKRCRRGEGQIPLCICWL